MKVFEIAAKKGKNSSEILEVLKKNGSSVNSHLSVLTESDEKIINDAFANVEHHAVTVEPIVEEKKVKILFCPRCQRGPSGHPNFDNLHHGSPCPFCEELAANGHIAPDKISTLWEGNTWWDELRKRGELEKKLSSTSIKHIETGPDAKIKELEKQLSEMKALLTKLQPK